MATRSEQFRASAQRKGERSAPKPAAKGTSAKKSAKRATPRKQRVKTDAPLNIREELTKGSPEARYRKARAKRVRARGS
jgi:hypothetical protein